MRRIALMIFFAVVSGPHICTAAAQTAPIRLTQWTLDIGGRSFTVSPVLWDKPVSGGGAGYTANGTGTYTASFTIPDELRKEQLAFFVSSIDDADRAWFNGIFIGESGRFPASDGSGFRSAVRTPRLYVIPQSAVRDGTNEIRIDVFDFAGSGGFNGAEPPVIGPYLMLEKKASAQLRISEGVRIMFLAVLLSLLIALAVLIAVYGTRQSARYALRRIRLSFSTIRFIRQTACPKIDFKGEVIFRSTMNAVTTLCFAFFILTETTFKFSIIDSEYIWFKGTEIALFAGFLAVIAIFHPDLFGAVLPSPENPVRRWTVRFFAVATHPGVLSLFMVYLVLLPVRQSWSSFIIAGSALMFAVLTLMFAASLVRMLNAGFRAKTSAASAVLIRTAVLRIIFTAGFIAGIAIFRSGRPDIYSQSSLIVTTFTLFYMISALVFFLKHRVSLYENREAEDIGFVLNDRYDLTPSEVRISTLIAHGVPREEICRRTAITPSTLKIHLKSIYTKTIETGPFAKDSKAGKFQRLTIFLHSLERGDAQ